MIFVLDSIIGSSITLYSLLICTGASLVLGLGVAAIHMYKNTYSKSFALTLALLPAIVQLVIMVVNGNIGTGVAVAGAFSLVRFRSVPGGAREICSIFLAMALGLASGMGYIAAAALFFVIMGAVTLLLTGIRFGESRGFERDLRITIPETLDYDGIFDDVFQRYTTATELYRVKTSNMGTLYELRYKITLKDNTISKGFLDELRTRNGNLNIICGRELPDDKL